jgi:hypothetical protein
LGWAIPAITPATSECSGLIETTTCGLACALEIPSLIVSKMAMSAAFKCIRGSCLLPQAML